VKRCRSSLWSADMRCRCGSTVHRRPRGDASGTTHQSWAQGCWTAQKLIMRDIRGRGEWQSPHRWRVRTRVVTGFGRRLQGWAAVGVASTVWCLRHGREELGAASGVVKGERVRGDFYIAGVAGGRQSGERSWRPVAVRFYGLQNCCFKREGDGVGAPVSGLGEEGTRCLSRMENGMARRCSAWDGGGFAATGEWI
jgi:hypothetical protein